MTLSPHTWAYYSDTACPICSFNPVDVRIAYLGNGTNTVNTGNNTTSGWSADATTVKVGPDAPENKFIYYKTLERTDGTTATTVSAATGRCAYTLIPNPFSVRPTYGTDNTSKWRGFYRWRLKSCTGGSVYTTDTGGTPLMPGTSTVEAESVVYFAKDDNADYMAVEFEALWARAYVQSGTTNLGSSNRADSYERNFHIISANGNASSYQKSYPCTVSSYYPDGTSATMRTLNGAFTASADTKFENVTFNSGSSTFTAAGHNLTLGHGCSGTINYLCGINATTNNPRYKLRIESGTINYLSMFSGYIDANEANQGTAYYIYGTPSVTATLGCDYDRATNGGITDNLVVTYSVFMARGMAERNGYTTYYSDNAYTAYVKSGKIGNGFDLDNNYSAGAYQTFYMGGAGNRVRGHRKLYIEGGELASVAGGIDKDANQGWNSFSLRMTGGHIRRVIFGGGKGALSDLEAAKITGNTDVTLKGSIEVMHNVYGGGHLGKVDGSTSVKLR